MVDGAVEASEQVQPNRRESVIKLAEANYKLKSNLNHEFYISFNSMAPLIDIKSTATKLVNFIISIEKTLGNFFTNNAFNISPEIYSIYRSSKQYPDAKWQTSQVFNGKNLQVARVREIVQQKNDKVSGYMHCDNYWLLLIVDFMDSAQDQEIEWPTDEAPIECKFEKVIIYKPQFKRYSDIPVNRIYC